MYDLSSEVCICLFIKLCIVKLCFLSLMYDGLSIMTMTLPLSAGLIIIYLLCFKDLIDLYSLVRFFFLGSLYIYLCKSCSIEQNIDSN